MYVSNPELAKFFEEVASVLKKKELIALASNYIISDDASKISSKNLSEIILMIDGGKLSSRGAKDLIAIIAEKGGDAKNVATKNDLLQVSDTGALAKVAEKIISANPTVVADFKAGKKASLQFLVGQGMKETKGSADPKALAAALDSKIAAIK
jgi:aspartyl-tRNA(Asn)/glutamyl-tRNA(Gln) amidotransferase subunit B